MGRNTLDGRRRWSLYASGCWDRFHCTLYFSLPPQSGVDYCFDTVEMVLWPVNEIASGKGDRETHVLVPILSETGVSVVLESDLDSDTHYKATLSVNSLPLTSTTFCE